jgi:septal ring factor EnvC (AmiA/AmiB activator)|tara:strand:- start:1161 stop:1532 length:372 start_codon:yes stop_codon:yes gene_type:complete
MEDVTKDKDSIILLVIIAGLVGWNIFTTNTIKTDVKGYEKKIESIKTKIDSSQAINKQIDTKIGEVKENVTTITNEIHHIDKNITVIKKQTDEKVNNVDNIPDSELELFFTNKYEQPISNTGK